MNIYSAVMLDIDGFHEHMPPKTRALLARLEKRGIPVVLCSGQSPGSVEKTAQTAELHGLRVCYGGSLVLDAAQTLLWDTGMDVETAVRFRDFALRLFPAVQVTSFLYHIWLSDGAEVAAPQWGKGTERLEGRLEDAARASGHVHKMLCLGPPADMVRLRQRTEQNFPSLRLFSTVAGTLELTAKTASLSAALEVVCRHFGLNAEQIVAAGDRRSDTELLRSAGLGVVPETAPEEVRQAADRMTASVADEGVYIALKALRFRPPDHDGT